MSKKNNTIIGNTETGKYKDLTLQEVKNAISDAFSKYREKPKEREVMIYVITPYGLISHEAILSGRLSPEAMNCTQVKNFLKQFNKAMKEVSIERFQNKSD